MNYNNAEIALTVNLRGALAATAVTQFVPNTDKNGKLVHNTYKGVAGVCNYPDGKLKILSNTRYYDSCVNTILNNIFVKNAISQDGLIAINRSKTSKAKYSKSFWNKASKKQKLEMSIERYVRDVYPGCSFSYEVLE